MAISSAVSISWACWEAHLISFRRGCVRCLNRKIAQYLLSLISPGCISLRFERRQEDCSLCSASSWQYQRSHHPWPASFSWSFTEQRKHRSENEHCAFLDSLRCLRSCLVTHLCCANGSTLHLWDIRHLSWKKGISSSWTCQERQQRPISCRLSLPFSFLLLHLFSYLEPQAAACPCFQLKLVSNRLGVTFSPSCFLPFSLSLEADLS